MFGANPGCFRSLQAVKMACRAYQIETGKKQAVVKKSNYYTSCEVDDLEIAKKEGYELVEYI